jgi:hypothetical protein
LNRLSPATATSAIILSQNHFPKSAYVDFSSSDFNVQGHILSTGGDALTHCKAQEKPYYNRKHTHTHHMGMTSHLEVAVGFWPLLNNRCKFVPFDLGDIFIDVKKGFF